MGPSEPVRKAVDDRAAGRSKLVERRREEDRLPARLSPRTGFVSLGSGFEQLTMRLPPTKWPPASCEAPFSQGALRPDAPKAPGPSLADDEEEDAAEEGMLLRTRPRSRLRDRGKGGPLGRLRSNAEPDEPAPASRSKSRTVRAKLDSSKPGSNKLDLEGPAASTPSSPSSAPLASWPAPSAPSSPRPGFRGDQMVSKWGRECRDASPDKP